MPGATLEGRKYFLGPPYVKGIIESSGNSIQQDSKYNHTKHAGKNWELFGVGVGIVADGTCPNQNDFNKVLVLGFNLTLNFNNTVNQSHTLNALEYDI